MSRSKRWQPPHPDPAKITVEPTPASQARTLRGTVLDKCCYPRCPKYVSFHIRLALCDAHIKIVHDAYEADERELHDTQEQIVADHLDAVQASTEAIDNGMKPAPGQPIPGWVYYIRVDDTIKIGYAKHVATRMRAYPPNAELLAVEPGTLKLERQRHEHFHAYLAWGREWFRTSDELMAWITELRRHYDPRPLTYQYKRPGRPEIVGSRRNRGVKKTAA